MKEHIVEKITRYVVPFSYALPLDEAINRVENCENASITFRKESADIEQCTESDIYEYVRNEFKYSADNNRKKMGCSFKAVLDKNHPVLELVLESKLFSSENIGKQDILVLDELGIILGRNGVGFIWYEFCTQGNEVKPVKVDDFIDFQNQFKELCRNDQKVSFWNRIRVTENNKDYINIPTVGIKEEKRINDEIKQTNYYTPFSMGNWLAELLEFLQVKFTPERKNPIETIYKTVKKKDIDVVNRSNMTYQIIDGEAISKSPKYIPDKALLFSFCCFDVEERTTLDDDIIKNLVYFSNGYKSSYAIEPDIRTKIFTPFSNVAWFVSNEGCAGVALPTPESNEFMRSTLLSKAKVDYFTLYMKCLFQSYSLLSYAERIQNELSAVKTDYLEEAEEKTIENLVGSINLFLTKSMATSVSHIGHQSAFYIYIKERLHIHEDVKSVTSGLESLSEIEKENIQVKEAENSDRIQAVMGLFSVLVIGSALLDTYELLGKFIPTWDLYSVLAGNPIYIAIYVVVFIFMITVSAIAAVYAFKAIRATRYSSKKNKKKNVKKDNKK